MKDIEQCCRGKKHQDPDGLRRRMCSPPDPPEPEPDPDNEPPLPGGPDD